MEGSRGPELQADRTGWKEPSPFEIVRELNAHAGRHVTLLGFTVALTSLSVTIGPIHPAVQSFQPGTYWLVYLLLVFIAIGLSYAAIDVYMELEPPVPDDIKDEIEWLVLLDSKNDIRRRPPRILAACCGCLIIASMTTFIDSPESMLLVWFPLSLIPMFLTCQSFFRRYPPAKIRLPRFFIPKRRRAVMPRRDSAEAPSTSAQIF